MASFKNYFNYTFKNSLTRLIVCLVIALLLTVFFVDVYSYETYEYVKPDTDTEDTYIEGEEYKEKEENYIKVRRTDVEFSVISFVFGTLCFFVPLLELEPFKNRRNIDTLFNLPVSKFKMGLAHYLNGLIHVVGIFTVCSVYAFFFLISKSDELNIVKFIPYYFLMVLFGIMLYSFVSFIFYQGNTVTDGILFVVLYSFVFMLFVGVIDCFLDYKDTIDVSSYTAFSPISYVTSIYTNLIEKDDIHYDTETYISFVFWIIIGIASIFGFLYTFAKKKAEDVGEISSSIFGYKTLIPIYAYSLLLIFQDLLTVLILIAAFVGYIIYRRSIKLKKSDYLCLALSILPILLCYIIFD